MARKLTRSEKTTRTLVAKNLRGAMTWWPEQSIRQLAKKARTSPSTVHNILGYRTSATTDVLARLAVALNVEVSDLFGEIEPYAKEYT